MAIGLDYIASPTIKTRQQLLQKREERTKSEIAKNMEKGVAAKAKGKGASIGILQIQEQRITQRDDAVANFNQ